MEPLTEDELRALNPSALAARMEAFFAERARDAFPGVPLNILRLAVVTAPAMLETRAMAALTEHDQKRALVFFYASGYQEVLGQWYAGLNWDLNRERGELGPDFTRARVQVATAGRRQASIIASRIQFECAMEFIHFVEARRLLPSGSKQKAFRKWCVQPGNRFGWLTYYLLWVAKFETRHRTPLVHGISRMTMDALRVAPRVIDQSELDLINLLGNLWRPVQRTLNGDPHGIWLVWDEPLLEEFRAWETMDLEAFWRLHTGQ